MAVHSEMIRESGRAMGLKQTLCQLCGRWIAEFMCFLRSPGLRELLWYCAPALFLGVALRALLTWQMPYGYMQFDSADFLATAVSFLTKGSLSIHSKRTFLVPILYTLPFVLRLPALIVIPIAQHLLGIAVILMSGALIRLWLAPWRWVIIPVTIILAANPVILWFEHALMSESVYLFCVFALALAGTLFTRQATSRQFAFVLVALFFTAAARPEGRLFFGFGFALVLAVQWGNWKTCWRRMAWLAGVALVTMLLTRTHQAGQLLYATVLPLAPDESKVDPEFGRLVRPLRDEVRRFRGGVPKKLQSLEQELADLSLDYLKAKGVRNPDGNALCQRMAIEACLNQPRALPGLALSKFLVASKGPTSIGYDEPRLHEKLDVGFNRKDQLIVLSRGLIGWQLNDESAVSSFIREHYHPLAWYSFLDSSWQRLTMPQARRAGVSVSSPLPELTLFFKLALAGMLITLLTIGPFQKFHVPWILSLALLWFAVALTGVDNPRYRYVFEPFCLIYIAVGAALLWMNALRLFEILTRNAQRTARLPAASPPPRTEPRSERPR